MKAKEILEVLQKVDPESEVLFMMNDGCCGDWLDLEAYDVNILESIKDGSWVRIHFNAVPGYRSCIQSGGTKRSHEEYWKTSKDHSNGKS